MPEPRFIVWSPTGPTSPRVTHHDHDDARTAARSMARLHRGQRFYVCELVDRFEAVEVVHVDLQHERHLADLARLTAAEGEMLGPVDAVEPAPVVAEPHIRGCKCAGCDIPF